ncbi:MAG: protein kinase [Acidobacteria bacterium]|nr:protein kinase [Acidobacteriota bacterium]
MENYHRVKELFQTAIDLSGEARAVFLAEACAGDTTLLMAVERLLAASDEAESFIEEPAFNLADNFITQKDTAAEPVEGSFIGHYRVIREIAHGGMGAVYLAMRADDQYKKRVAIKVIRGGANNDYLRRRFLSERQILASLDHPYIAKLLDGGTTEDGSPYLVMDYIEGEAIDEYCDNHKLSTAERLQLFRQVCAAVHYAHQNLVIHRDLKPGNILVTADGTPRLLDFGIAKLLNPELAGQTLDMTAGPLGPMTPEYASPEQVRGESLTTSSDIYSLGVVLYELLTGHRPYKFGSRVPHVIAQIICEQEPERPSTVINRIETNPYGISDTDITISPEIVSRTREGQIEKLRRRLRGDLDNIVLMAMRKEPQRRYASVEQFAEDLRRHLYGLPCIARKATLSYRTSKFIKRNKVAVAAGVLIALSLIGGVITTLWEAHNASLQKAKAEQRFNDVRALANAFMFDIHDKIETLPGSTPARQLLVNKALQYLDKLAREAGGDTTLQRELATAYMKVGDIQGNPVVANLGDMNGALASYQKALQIRQALPTASAHQLDAEIELANNYDRVGDMVLIDHDLNATTENYQQALAIRERLAAQQPNNTQVRFDLSLSYSNLGDVLSEDGKPQAALEQYSKARTMREPLLAQEPLNATYRRSIAILYQRIATNMYYLGDKAGAIATSRQSLVKMEALAKDYPQNAKAQREVAFAYNNLGDLLWYNDDLKDAMENYQIGLRMREALLQTDPTNMQAQRDVAISYGNYGYTLAQKGDEKGLELYRRSVEITEGLLTVNPDMANAMRDVAVTYSYFGEVYGLLAARKELPVAKRLAYYEQALAYNERSIKIWVEMRDRGILKSRDRNTADKITASLAAYHSEMEKLKK